MRGLVRRRLILGTLGLMLVPLRLHSQSPTTPAPSVEKGTASVKPGINADFLNPDLNPAPWVERFEKEGREVYDQRQRIVSALGLKPGSTVADVGAGTGLFTFLFADAVGPGGKVYAVDISPALLGYLRRRASERKDNSVVVVQGAERDARLPDESVDRVYICDTYHHFEYPTPMLASIHRALRPGGELVLVEFKRVPGESSDWVLNHVRAGQDVFESEIRAAGFERVDEPVTLKENYVVRFRKPAK
ncbi:MAG: methyltransferase domain-containing protein [Verrucomicrobiales bacterium]|nr:methyltransferase domain-containing protein [Verrucomicrobiales bacterium]